MAWNLQGTYLETCSRELICPCNASLSHGATYERCRVTLVFNIMEGQVEGSAASGNPDVGADAARAGGSARDEFLDGAGLNEGTRNPRRRD
jgi:hypothetical protein